MRGTDPDRLGNSITVFGKTQAFTAGITYTTKLKIRQDAVGLVNIEEIPSLFLIGESKIAMKFRNQDLKMCLEHADVEVMQPFLLVHDERSESKMVFA